MRILQRKWKIIAGVVLLVVVFISFATWKLWHKSKVPTAPPSQGAFSDTTKKFSESETPKPHLPLGDRITFENASDISVIKNHSDEAYTYDFVYDEKVFGHVVLSGNWWVGHLFSYREGSEYFGFSLSGSGTAGKEYWGPSVLYRANGLRGSLEKIADFSFDAIMAAGKEVVPNSWGSDYFITDLSEDETIVVYCDFWQDNNHIFLKDVLTGEEKIFPIDTALSDFGDAIISPDKQTIAFAGIKRTQSADGSLGEFIEADIFTLDVASGEINTYQTNKMPGAYALDSWDGTQVKYNYTEGDTREE